MARDNIIVNKLHWEGLAQEIKGFNTFLECFKRTAPGVRYYVNCTAEEDAKDHAELAEYILEVLGCIREMEIGVYKTMLAYYSEELRDVVKVYRESKGGG